MIPDQGPASRGLVPWVGSGQRSLFMKHAQKLPTLFTAAAATILLGGCIAVPVQGGGYVAGPPAVYVAPAPVVVIDPFPHIWIGPGHYGGRYYDRHPGHGRDRGHR